MVVVQQLAEELHQAVQRRVMLERELSSITFCIDVLKRELVERLPVAQSP